MSNVRVFVLVGLAAAGCGSGNSTPDAAIDQQTVDMKVWSDAPPTMYDFSCMGNAKPTTGAANVTLSGTVTKVAISGGISISGLSGASVKACKVGASNCTGPNQYGSTATSSGTNGDWSIGPISTGSMPLPAYAEMTESSSRTVYEYPPSDFVGDQSGIPMLTFDSSAVGALSFFGCSQNDGANGMIGVAAVDCTDAPIQDTAYLTFTVKQGGAVVQGTSTVDVGTLPNASMFKGTYLICNVPENATTTIEATYDGKALLPRDVKVVKGTTTAALLRPGY